MGDSVLATVGGIAARPWMVDGEVCVRDILHLTLSFDHDVVDDAPAARFAARLVELLSKAEPFWLPEGGHRTKESPE